MNKRVAVKIVMDRILPAAAPFVAAGDGPCYSDRERRAARIFVRRRVVKQVKPIRRNQGWEDPN